MVSKVAYIEIVPYQDDYSNGTDDAASNLVFTVNQTETVITYQQLPLIMSIKCSQ